MKKTVLLFLLLYSYNCLSNTAIIEKNQLTLDYYRGVVANGDTVIVYGSDGNIRISYDNADTWNQVKIFKRGYINKVFLESERIVAFSESEGIALSYDRAKTWTIAGKPVDSIFAAIQYPGGYFIRSGKKLITIGKDLNVINSYGLFTRMDYNTDYPPYDYRYAFSIEYFDGQFIVETDSAKLLVFDSELQLTDTVAFIKTGLSSKCISKRQIGADSGYFYYAVDSSLFRTKDFNTWENICKSKSFFKIYDNKLYILNYYYDIKNYTEPFKCELYLFIRKDSIQLINQPQTEERREIYALLTNFTVDSNRLFVTGAANFLTMNNINDSIITNYSYVSGIQWSIPDRIDDSTYLIVRGFAGTYYPYIFLTKDDFMTITPRVNYDSCSFNKAPALLLFYIKYYDEKEKKLYLGGSDSKGKKGIFISRDFGKTFEYKPVPEMDVSPTAFPDPFYPKLKQFPNLQALDDYFVTGSYTEFRDTAYSRIFFFDKNFNLLHKYYFKCFAVDYIHATDTNTFLIQCLNSNDNAFEVKYTSDKGTTWEIIKKYKVSDSLIWYRELEIKGKKIVFMSFFNQVDSVYNYEALDVEKREIRDIYKCHYIYDYENMNNGNAVCSYKDTVYFSVKDTLFYMTDIYNRNTWNYYLLPDKGVIRQCLQKFGDKFFCCYKDTNCSYWNNFWLKINTDSTVSVVEAETTSDGTYLYLYPPKPTPSTNHVRTLVYFDPKVEFDLSKVGVTDVTGARIEGGENISFEWLSPYSGYLNWNCSQAANGVYFIHIRHGNNARVAKVIVNR